MAKEADKIVFSADNEYVFEVKFDDSYLLFNGLVAYQFSDTWYFPLYELTSKLGLSFSYATDSNIVHGNIISESRPLTVNLAKCTANYNEQIETFDCNQVKIYNDEIFISQKLYEKWLNIQFKILPLQSLINLETQELFPIVGKIKREQGGEINLKPSSTSFDYGYPFLRKKYNLVDGFSQDVSLGFQYNKNYSRNFQNTNLQTNLTAEIFEFETHLDLSVQNNHITDKFLNFKKVNEEAELFGSLHARQVDLYNFYFPSFALIGGNELVTGASITNAHFNTPTNFSSHHFQGELLAGWDVELFQNNLLIMRQTGSSKGQYSFTDIPLLYGINRFELIFYGPQGQVRHEYQTFQIGQSMSSDKNIKYRVAAGLTKKNQSLKALSFEKSLTENLSLNVGYSESYLFDLPEKKQYILGGINGFSRSLYYSFAVANNINSGTAYKGTLSIPYRSLNFKIDRAQLKKFRSREFEQTFSTNELESQTNFEIFSPIFNNVITRNQFTINQYSSGEKIRHLNNNLFLNTKYLDFGNEADWDSARNVWKFSPYLYKQMLNSSLRLESSFEKSFNFINYKVEARHSLSELYDFSLLYLKEISTKNSEYGATLTRFFKSYSASLQTTVQNSNNYSISCNFNFSFLTEPRKGDFLFTKNALRDKGSLSLLAFEDINSNGIKDESERILPNVEFRILQTNQIAETNSKGIAFFSDLPSYGKLDVAIVEKTLPTIQHRSIEKGYRFVAGPGSSNRINFPIVILGDLEGSILIEYLPKTFIKRGILVRLKDEQNNVIRETRTDSEGYYLLEGTSPGVYTVEASYSKDGKKYLQSQSTTIDPRGESQNGIDFHIRNSVN